MILTGTEIVKEKLKGNITIVPFSIEQVNPNSYNYRLGSTLKIFDRFDGNKSIFNKITILNTPIIVLKRADFSSFSFIKFSID